MKGDPITGRAVVSIAEGTKLGRVDEVLVDTEELRVVALHVTAKDTEAVIPFDQVRSVGTDAVTVPSTRVAQRASGEQAVDSVAGLQELGKRKVVDEDGTFLGTVRGVVLNPDDGQLTELQTHKGGMLGVGGMSYTIPADEVTSVGDELLVVQAPEPVDAGAADAFQLEPNTPQHERDDGAVAGPGRGSRRRTTPAVPSGEGGRPRGTRR